MTEKKPDPTPENTAGKQQEESEKKDQTQASTGSAASACARPAGEAFREAMRQVGEFGQTLGGAIQTRDNVLMVRVNSDTVKRLDRLVDAEICRSRSEAAAFLISEGIKHNEALYVKINDITDKIAALRAQLKNDINQEVEK